MTAKKENRGGARPNSGPKRQTLSVRQIREMRKAAEKRAKQEGKTLYDILLDFSYDADLSVKDRQASIKLYLDKMHISVSEGGETDQALGPSIYLPEQKPTLAAVTDINEAKKDAADA